jgi:hypothetical protein
MNKGERERIFGRLAELHQVSRGIEEIIKRFVETGCYSPENPNQNQGWCSCSKPFCYECVAGMIALKLYTAGYRLMPKSQTKMKCPECGTLLEHFGGLENIPEYYYCPKCNDKAYNEDEEVIARLE